MSENARKCSCCKAYRPLRWFDGDENTRFETYSSCFMCRRKWREWKVKKRAQQRQIDNPDTPVGYKYCPRCNGSRGAMVPITNFGFNKRNLDGYADRCRDCQAIQNEARREARLFSASATNPCLREVATLTPQEVADRLAKGLIPDQFPGYWMKPQLDGRSPCWKEIRDYTNAWDRIFRKRKSPTTKDEVTDLHAEEFEDTSPPWGLVGAPLLGPPQLDPGDTPADGAPAPLDVEMLAAVAD